MTGATKASKREARAIRRACPQEAIRRASIRPDDAAAAAATTMASLAERKDPAMDGAFEAAAKEAAGPVLSEVFEADDSEEEQDEMPEPAAPLRMNRVSRKEKNAVRRACPREGLRRASIRPDAMAHAQVIQAAIEAQGRVSAPAAMEGGSSAARQQRPQSPSRPNSADFSPRTRKAVRRVMPKKSMSFRELQQQPRAVERPSMEDLTDLATIGKEGAGVCPPGELVGGRAQGAAFPA